MTVVFAQALQFARHFFQKNDSASLTDSSCLIAKNCYKANVKFVSMLGHSGLGEVTRYAHPSEQRKSDAFKSLQKKTGKSSLTHLIRDVSKNVSITCSYGMILNDFLTLKNHSVSFRFDAARVGVKRREFELCLLLLSPPPCRRICGISYYIARNSPMTFVRRMSRKFSSEIP